VDQKDPLTIGLKKSIH